MILTTLTLVILLIIMVGTAPFIYATNVTAELGDLQSEDKGNSSWKTYHSPNKDFAINYYDAPNLFPQQDLSETGEWIRLVTMPMIIHMDYKEKFDSDPEAIALNMQLQDQVKGDMVVRGVYKQLVDDEIGYSYVKTDKDNEVFLQVVIVNHDGNRYAVFLAAPNDQDTLEEFDKTVESIKLSD